MNVVEVAVDGNRMVHWRPVTGAGQGMDRWSGGWIGLPTTVVDTGGVSEVRRMRSGQVDGVALGTGGVDEATARTGSTRPRVAWAKSTKLHVGGVRIRQWDWNQEECQGQEE